MIFFAFMTITFIYITETSSITILNYFAKHIFATFLLYFDIIMEKKVHKNDSMFQLVIFHSQ